MRRYHDGYGASDGKMLRVKIWTPKTDSDRRLVQQELSAILASPHFSSSKRYPAFLRYVVQKCLDGQSDQLKERTLGIEVFGRPHDYDTNAEPVVRIIASEVRKRIAQYYHEAATESEIQIGLPLGSYTPEFRTKHTPTMSSPNRGLEPLPGSANPIESPIRSNAAGSIERSRLSRALPKWFLRRPLAWTIGLALVLMSLGAYFVNFAFSLNREEQLWAPLVQKQEPVLIVIGCGKPWLDSPESPQTSLSDHMIGPYHHVSVPDTVAVSRLANVLQKHNRNYFIKEVSASSLTDLRNRTIILVGALNNAWTMRLTDPLRFRFVPGNVARIEDTKNPQNSAWSVDYSKPYTAVVVDYGIVARYHDTYTNGNVMVIAGIGPYGTEAASEFVSSPQYLSQVEHFIPDGFKEANLEIVIKTDVINGEAGPPHVVAAYAF
jgi:hypothetical protein